MKRRWLLTVIVALLAGALSLTWHYCSKQHSPYEPSAQELAEVKAFGEEVRQDSIRRAEQRQREWQERQAQWDAEREARRDSARRAHRRDLPEWATPEAYAERQERRRVRDSIYHSRPEKLTAGMHINANTADTLTMQKIPGIGPVMARIIVDYRERLGGFVNTAQVAEAYDKLPPDIGQWIEIPANAATRKIPINTADFKTLLRHPYLNYEQTKVIVNRRRLLGKLKGWNDLKNDPHFTAKDFERLTPYFSF